MPTPFETCARIAVRNDSILLTFSVDSFVIAIDGVSVYKPPLNLAEVQLLMMTIFLFGSGASAIDGVSVYKP